MEIEILPDLNEPYKWHSKYGSGIPITKMDTKLFLELYHSLMQLAEMKRRALIAVFEQFSFKIARDQLEMLKASTWHAYVEPDFDYFLQEAERRQIAVRGDPVLEEDKAIDLNARGSLERLVAGAIKDSINAHGPVTKDNLSSAAKRVIAAIKVFNRSAK